MENSNIEFKTALGTEIVLRPYITGRQAEILTEVTGETTEKKNIALSHKTIELVVVSVNGKSDKVVEDILDLPFADYIEITEKVQEVATGKKKEMSTE